MFDDTKPLFVLYNKVNISIDKISEIFGNSNIQIIYLPDNSLSKNTARMELLYNPYKKVEDLYFQRNIDRINNILSESEVSRELKGEIQAIIRDLLIDSI